MVSCHSVLPSFLVSKPMTNSRYPDISYTHEEGFTGTWAYDQVWASLRHYSMTRASDGKEFKFKQTGHKSSDQSYDYAISGFEFGPEGDEPVFGLVMRHYGEEGPEANHRIRADIEAFFEHGAQVAWEIDVPGNCAVRVYRATNPDQAVVYRMGEIAEAEPALPGWKMAVSDLSYNRDEGILSVSALLNPHGAPADFLAIPGKAEIVRGAVMHFSLAGGLSGWAGDQIFSSLCDYARRTKLGIAVGDNKAFVVNLPGRKSFSPNVAFHRGKMRSGYYFGAPVFAVEVRNGLDYSNDSYGRVSAKIKDYFSAGTQVVWDVDVLVYGEVWVYRKDNPDERIVYGRGEKAEAEPAVPGWSVPVDDLFYPYADDIEE